MKEGLQENKYEPAVAGRQAPKRDLALQVFVQLNTARKIGEFCSSDHPLCLEAAQRAAEMAHSLNGENGEVKFTSGPRVISFGSTRFEPGVPYLNDFAEILASAGITVVRLGNGVSPDGLVRFSRLLAARSDPQVGDGQIRQFLCGSVAEGIRVGMLPSPGVLDQSDDKRPDSGPATEVLATDDAVWQEEVRRLLAGESAENPIVLTDIDPCRVADLINGLDFMVRVDVISGSFLSRVLPHPGTDQSRHDTTVPGGTVKWYLELLKSLSPDHQVKFITAALEMSHSFTGFAATILEAVPIHLSGQAFTGIERNEENRVHPRITDRFAALCRITGLTAAGEIEGPGELSGEVKPGTDDFQVELLDDVPMGTEPESATPAPAPHPVVLKPPPFIAAEFSLKGKRKALIRVALDLLERSTSISETRAHSDTLPVLFTEALKERDWASLNHDWTNLTELVKRGREAKPFLSRALHRIQKSFTTLQAMEIIVAGIAKSTAETRTLHFEWIPKLGKSACESLVLALIAADDRNERQNLLSAIVALGEDAIPLALKRVTDHRWYVVRNMISIIREVGDKRAGEDLLALTNHPQFQVRRELVNTLLSLKHSAGLKLAEKGIRGNEQKMKSACIGLLGSNRVEGGRKILLQILEDRFRGGDPFDQAQKISAVWALGQIGSSSVLSTLHGLLKKNRIIKSPDSHELKMAILRSLPGYPLEAVEPLARWGACNGEENEAVTCTQLLTNLQTRREVSGP